MWIYDVSPDVAAKSNWRLIVGLVLASTIVMMLIFILRMWVKRWKLVSEGWVLVGAMICNIFYSICAVLQTRYGLGLPVLLRPKSSKYWYTVYNYSARGPNCVANALSKIAICISCIKMVANTNFWRYRWFCVGVAVFTGALWFALLVIEVFNCRPFMKSTYPQLPGYCVPYEPSTMSIWAINILDDVLVYLLPVPLITKLRLDRFVKICLIVSFAMGFITTIFSILKMTQVPRVAHGDHNSSLLVLYMAVEGNIGAMSASWPVLRSLVTQHITKRIATFFTFGSTSRSGVRSYEMTDDPNTPTQRRHDNRGSVGPNSRGTKMASEAHDGNESDEIALVDEPWDERGIVKTAHYRVETSQASPQTRGGKAHDWSINRV